MDKLEREDFENRYRLDFALKTVTDECTGQQREVVVFDPARYSIADREGETVLIDRLDDLELPANLVCQMIEQALGMTPTIQGQSLGDAAEYVRLRREKIGQLVDDPGDDAYTFVDRSEEFLAQLPDGVHPFAVVSVDLVGSTILSNALDEVSYARVIGVVLRELAAVASPFNAHILKFTGDGVLAYLPAGSFLAANNNAIDYALTARRLVLDAIVPALAERGYPPLGVRIGIESGGAVAMTVGDAGSKRHRDLVGQTLNIACKIQASGASGEIRAGQVAYQNMHTMWKFGFERVPSPASWNMALHNGEAYPVYLFSAAGPILQ